MVTATALPSTLFLTILQACLSFTSLQFYFQPRWSLDEQKFLPSKTGHRTLLETILETGSACYEDPPFMCIDKNTTEGRIQTKTCFELVACKCKVLKNLSACRLRNSCQCSMAQF